MRWFLRKRRSAWPSVPTEPTSAWAGASRAGLLLVAALHAGLGAPARSAAGVPDRVIVLEELVTDHAAGAGFPRVADRTRIHVQSGSVWMAWVRGPWAQEFEVGGGWRDARRSSYVVSLRRRQGSTLRDTFVDLRTGQVLGRWVPSLATRLVIATGGTLYVAPAVGVSYYHLSRSFVRFEILPDPRPDTGTTLVFVERIGWSGGYLEGRLAPRTDGVVGTAWRLQWGAWMLGYAHEPDFDYTRLRRQSWALGWTWPPPR